MHALGHLEVKFSGHQKHDRTREVFPFSDVCYYSHPFFFFSSLSIFVCFVFERRMTLGIFFLKKAHATIDF